MTSAQFTIQLFGVRIFLIAHFPQAIPRQLAHVLITGLSKGIG
jgi:hypothetical protein